MEPVPLQNCIDQLESLEYNPIIGNKTLSQSKIRSKSFSQLPTRSSNLVKPKLYSATFAASSLSPRRATPRNKRTFSETCTSPSEMAENEETENLAKQPKLNENLLEQMFEKYFKANREEAHEENEKHRAELSKLSDRLLKTEQTIDKNFEQLSSQMSDLRSRQDQETVARQSLQDTVTTLQGQVEEMRDRIDQGAAPDTTTIVDTLLPLVTDALSDKINSNTAQVKAYNEQAKATYFQSLANEIKSLENDLMVYGYKPDGGPDIATEIQKKVFKNIMDLDIAHVKAEFVGTATGDKPRAIKVSLPSVESRNNVLREGRKLPKNVKVEKCMPRRYRPKNKDFQRHARELKQVDNSLITRTVFKGHKLVLEMKQKDQDNIKYDWTIAKEYYPEPESPTDHSEARRNRQGLKPSKTLEMVSKNFVFFYNLSVKDSKEDTVKYFMEVYLDQQDRDMVVETDNTQVMEKYFMKVELSDRQHCYKFRDTYEKRPFNGKAPKVSVFLDKD